MTNFYRVEFAPRAAKAFGKFDVAIQRQIAKKLAERRHHPRVPGDRSRELPDCYKIKLRSSGFRLVYQVRDTLLVILVLAIDRREGEEAYRLAQRELARMDD